VFGIKRFMTFFVFIIASSSCGVMADELDDETIRLSEVSAASFECTAYASDWEEYQRLFDLGLAAGRKFWGKYGKLDQATRNKLTLEQSKISLDWWAVSGPSADFAVGYFFHGVVESFVDRLHGKSPAEWIEAKRRLYVEKNCGALR
jgi:hypothetical protein